MEDEPGADDLRADGADELRLHAAHAGRGRDWLGLRYHGRRVALRLDLLRGRAAPLEEGPAACRPPLPRLAPALRIPRIRGSPALDAGEGGPVGQGRRPGRETADGGGVRDQLKVCVDVLGAGVEGGTVAGVRSGLWQRGCPSARASGTQ